MLSLFFFFLFLFPSFLLKLDPCVCRARKKPQLHLLGYEKMGVQAPTLLDHPSSKPVIYIHSIFHTTNSCEGVQACLCEGVFFFFFFSFIPLMESPQISHLFLLATLFKITVILSQPSV